MTIDDFPRQLASTRRFTLGVPRAVTVSADGGRVLFLRTRGGEDPITCLWGLDLADCAGNSGGGRERLLADPAASWHAGPGDVPQAERVRRERERELAAGIVAYSADESCRMVVFARPGSTILRSSAGGSQTRLWARTLVPADGLGTVIALQTSQTPPQDHPCMHLDLHVADTGEQAAEVDRLVALGASRVDWDSYPEDPDFVVLADPDGHLFCIVDLSHDQGGA